MIRKKLLMAGSVLAMGAIAPALAQQADVEQVVVSASRIAVAGYTAPTPVTVVGAAQLERDAQPDIGDALRELPSVGFAVSMNTGTNASTQNGTNGLDLINLRQLGVPRTLVLFDGQRVVNANTTGGVDLATMPSSLVQRVDIVTGGASAAWGSDAVAGVVNVILNKNFSGFASNLEGSESYKGDLRSVKAEASFGTDVLGDRGHVIFNGSYTTSPDVVFLGTRDYAWNTHLFTNPAYTATNGQPQYIHVQNAGMSQATRGGLIQGCGVTSATSVNCALKNIQFIGPEATPTTFTPGLITGAFANGPSVESALYTGGGFQGELNAPYHSTTFFNHDSYKVTDNITASLEVSYGDLFAKSESGYQRLGNLPIAADNAYLPQSIKTQMAALGYNYIFLGTNNLNGSVPTTKTNVTDDSLEAAYGILGSVVPTIARQQFRAVASLDGSLGEDWTWNAYAQHGAVRTRSAMNHDPLISAYNNAVDAVTVTSANVGTSGLQVGSVACRSTLTAPTNGCVPLNVFGEHDVSAGAMNYVSNSLAHGGNWGLSITEQDVFAGSMSGQLPAEWALPAGRIAVAFGAETRKESGNLTSDANSKVTGWSIGNYSAYTGHYSVQEGFGEITVPVLKENMVQSLELNAAGRITSYSTSGMVETWKLGATSQVNDDLRLRTTWSFDIRAPNINELFATGNAGLSQLTDPYTHQSTTGFTVTGGNAHLQPEQSTTVSGGVVLTPHWIDGLNLSADWYSINIKKAITTISSTTTTTLCAGGDAFYCSQVYYQNGILFVNTNPINANNQSVSGLDFQGDYNFDFMDGSVDLALVGNYVDQQSQLAQGRFFDYAGSLGADSLVTGLPKFHSTLSATYHTGPWQATVQGRFIGAAKLNNAWVQGVNVDNNNVVPVAYLDLRGQYKLTGSITLYSAIDNVTNVPPPTYPSTTGASGTGVGTIYDAIGRMFRAGIRLKY